MANDMITIASQNITGNAPLQTGAALQKECALPSVEFITGGKRVKATNADRYTFFDTVPIPITPLTRSWFFVDPIGTQSALFGTGFKSEVDTNMKESGSFAFNEASVFIRCSWQIIHEDRSEVSLMEMINLMYHGVFEFYMNSPRETKRWSYLAHLIGSPGSPYGKIGGGFTGSSVYYGDNTHYNTTYIEPIVIAPQETFKLAFYTNAAFLLNSYKIKLRFFFDGYKTNNVI